jgi:hypothetical protein
MGCVMSVALLSSSMEAKAAFPSDNPAEQASKGIFFQNRWVPTSPSSPPSHADLLAPPSVLKL